MTLVEELKWRGLIKDISSPELEEKLNNGKLTCWTFINIFNIKKIKRCRA